MPTYWKIYARQSHHTEDAEDYAAICFDNKTIAVGWSKVGDLNDLESPPQLKAKLVRAYGWNVVKDKRKLASYASSLWSFRSHVREGDTILCPSKGSRHVYVGKVVSAKPSFDARKLEGKCDFAHRREVAWSRILNHKDILSVWPNGHFGGQQTVSEIKTNVSKLQKLLRHKKRSPEPKRHGGNKAWHADKEWGTEAERRAMTWLRSGGLKPIDVSRQNKGWDIECGKKLYEVKGRKSPKTDIRFTENEWKAAVKHGTRYTLLIFTAPSKAALRKAIPDRIPDPTHAREWRKRIVFEYFLQG